MNKQTECLTDPGVLVEDSFCSLFNDCSSRALREKRDKSFRVLPES